MLNRKEIIFANVVGFCFFVSLIAALMAFAFFLAECLYMLWLLVHG